MRLFVCSDIHMAVENLERLLLMAGKPIDAVLFAGDLTNWGSAADAAKVFSSFPDKPIFTIPGNLDTQAVLEAMEDQTKLVHNHKAALGDWSVVGFGGGSLNNPGDILFSDDDILKSLEPLLKAANPKKTILLTHQPPFNTKLDVSRGSHVGSRAVRVLIEKYQPAFQFCGHIHESWSEDEIGKSRCYNVAAVKEGRSAVLDLETFVFKRLAL